MANVIDVARYILSKEGPMTAMKLQKLVYYSKAWHLVWADSPLFRERIEAWANGPVSPDLYRLHRKKFQVSDADFTMGDESALTDSERASIDAVLKFYSGMSAHQLSELTHRELPWREARGEAGPGERCTNAITDAAMFEYYDGLTTSTQA